MSPGRDRQVLSDRLAIADLMVQYFVNVDRRRFDAVKGVFVPGTLVDYSDLMPIGNAVPAEEVVDRIEAAMAENYSTTLHNMGNHEVVVEGDRARSEIWVVAYHVYSDPSRQQGRLPVAGLRYLDRLVRTADGWRIEHRRATSDWRAWLEPRGPTYVDGRHQ